MQAAPILRVLSLSLAFLCCDQAPQVPLCEGSEIHFSGEQADCHDQFARCVEQDDGASCVRPTAEEGCRVLYGCGRELTLDDEPATELECVAELSLPGDCSGACLALTEDCAIDALRACIDPISCADVEPHPLGVPNEESPSSRGCGGGTSPPPSPTPSCCRVCTTGKACGDSCIAESSTCNAGPGCACNG